MNDAGRIGFVTRGEYDNTSLYNFLDVVYYGNSSYVAKKLTIGNEPEENSEYWQLIAKASGSTVTGIKGADETAYRTGDVNITPDNIGSYDKTYIDSNFVSKYISSAVTRISEKGWHRIAKSSAWYENSCVISIKRGYNSPSPEYQKIQLLSIFGKQKFVCLDSYAQTHMFTKIRETYDESAKTAYIEAYQDRDSSTNAWLISIEDAVGIYGDWTVIQPEKTEDTVTGVEVKTELDLPAGFDLSYLLPKDGNAASATKAAQDGNGNVIADTYAKKSIYGETGIFVGREQGAEIGSYSSVLGRYNYATGNYSSVLNGEWNDANGDYSSVLGLGNYAGADYSSVLGGENNFTRGSYSSVVCGEDNNANGDFSSVLGGFANSASGESSAVLGGMHAEAGNMASCASGKYNKKMTTGGGEKTQVGDVFVIGNGTGASNLSNALRVTYLGDIMGTKAFQSSGADYAEFIKPWWDGNIYDEDRVGLFVTVKDGLLYKANEGDYIAGITSGNPSVVGNADEDYYWRYERDELNRIVMEDVPEMIIKTKKEIIEANKTETRIEYVNPEDEDWEPEYDESGQPIPNEFYYETSVLDDEGNPVMEEIEQIVPVYENGKPVMIPTGKIIKNARMKLAEDYDPSLQDSYVERKYRKEWDYVGMVGVLPVRDDGTCLPGHFCRCGQDGIATFAEMRDFDAYMVIERISENVVSVIVK